MGENLNNILGIVASLIAILSPLISVILNKRSSSQNNGINFTTINNYSYNYNRNTTKRNDDNILNDITASITKNHKELIEYSETMLLLALVFTLSSFFIVAIGYSDLFFATKYITGMLEHGKHEFISYLISFSILFLGFFFTSYFLLAYYYDFRLRRDLQIFNYLHNRPILEKLQRSLIKEYKFSSFSVYPVQTLARLIENSNIKIRNRRRIKSRHENLKFFWIERFVIWAFLSLIIMHFAFKMAYNAPPPAPQPSINSNYTN